MSTQTHIRTLFMGGTVITMDAAVPNLATGDVLVEGDHVGAAMDKTASAAHLPHDLERLALIRNDSGLVRVGLFGQLNLDWWKAARSLDMRILTEFIGDLAKLGPEFAEKGVLGSHNISNHCTRVPEATWKLFTDTGINVTVNPRSDALFGFDDESFAYQQAIDHRLTPGLGIDLDTAFGSDLFGEMHALFGQQRSAMRYRRFRGEVSAPAPITVEAVLKAATVSGARAAGLEDAVGTLTLGKQADIIMVRTDGVAVFPVTNAIGTIVQAVDAAQLQENCHGTHLHFRFIHWPWPDGGRAARKPGPQSGRSRAQCGPR